MNTTAKRLKILGVDEIEALYKLPCFTDEERVEYFTLSWEDKTVLEQLHSNKSRLHFILQLGYFKARHLFFSFDLEAVWEDALYIQEQYFPAAHLTNIDISKGTRLRQQQLILELYNYQNCRTQERRRLELRAQQLARVDSRPIYIFRELMHDLATHRIVSPTYSVMQDIVGKALTSEQNRLTTALHCSLGASEIKTLKALLEDSKGLYEITLLKREPKDFGRREIAREIERGQKIQDLYGLAKTLLPCLDISSESIKYYASLVTYYSVFRLKQLDEWIVYLYLLCFVYHRYQKLYDNLLSTLIYHVRRYGDEAKSEAKERVYHQRVEGNDNLKKAGKLLKLFTDDSIAEHTPFWEVRAKAFGILERQKIDSVAALIATEARFDETAFQWDHIDRLTHQFKRHLRPILQAVDWSTSPGHRPLSEAIHFLKDVFSKRRPLNQYSLEVFPQSFIPDTVKRYLYQHDQNGQKHLLPDRYEFLVYRLLRNGLEAGDIFCRDSVRFRSFEDDLLDDRKWQEKDSLIVNTGLAILKQPIQAHLAELEEQLETRLYEVNQRIVSGENHHFEVKKRGPQVRWMLKPVRKLKPQLIIEEWDNIERILVSLALKTTTQSIIVGKLSAYARKNRTRQALWEYDNIIRSLYLLNYIDSPPLRQNVQRVLNRGESYNQLRRAVSYANYGKLRLKTEYEQQLWEECSRLVTNCIIFYNATILSNLLAHKESMGDLQEVALLKQVSPVAWQHINLQGRFEFKGAASNIDMEAILLELAQLPITQVIGV